MSGQEIDPQANQHKTMQDIQTGNHPAEKSKRPIGIRLVMVGWAGFSLYHLFQFAQAVLHWRTLTSLDLTSLPIILAVGGLIWAVIGIFLIWGLLKAKDWARKSSLASAAIFVLIKWINLIWFYEIPAQRGNWLANLILPAVILSVLVFIFYSRSSREYFGINKVRIP